MDTELREILGDDFAKALESSRDIVASKYGNLPSEKIAAVERLNADYAAIRQKSRKEPGGLLTALRVDQTLEVEFLQDLSRLLTPDEYRDYVTYNSLHATDLQQRLAASPISDPTYVILYNETEAIKDRYKKAGGAEMAYLADEAEVIARVAGFEAVANMGSKDSTYGEVDRMLRAKNMGQAELAQRYTAFLRFHGDVTDIQELSSSREEVYSGGKAAAQQTYQRVTAGFSESERKAFNTTKFGAFLARFGAGN